MNKKTIVEKVENTNDGKLRITAVMDMQELVDEFVPAYALQNELKDKLVPILAEEILKNKDEIVKKVLLEVNWPEIVRSEVAQKIIKEIAKGF